MDDTPKPKPLFYVVLLLVVLGLVGYAFRGTLFPSGAPPKGPQTSSDTDLTPADLKTTGGTEAPDANVPTTVKEYNFVASEKLPPVKEKSDYQPLVDRTVKFALNVWAGWAPIILQNGGSAPGKVWTTPGGEPFKVELVLIDNPVTMRDAYASGQVHIGWATLDMVPLFMEELKKDNRIMPRIFQQVDWSNGRSGA